MGPIGGAAAYLLAPFLAYFLCYVPQLVRAHSLYEFVATHQSMIAIMTGKSADHPYKSLWWTWPGLWRPVWYLFDSPSKEAGGWTEQAKAAAVVGLPNPVVLFAGQAAALWALGVGVLRRARGDADRGGRVPRAMAAVGGQPQGTGVLLLLLPLDPLPGSGPGAGRRGVAEAGAGRVLLGSDRGVGGDVRVLPPILVAGIGVAPSAFEARIWLPSWR